MKSRILFSLLILAFSTPFVQSQNVCLRTNNDFTSANGAGGVGNPKYIARADFNGDGILDLLTANTTSASVSLFFGGGNGLFTFQDTISILPNFPTSTPNGIITADFNGDGFQDFALVKRIPMANMNMRVMIGDGTGNFTTYADLTTSTNNPTDLVSGDFDGNGTIDIVTLSAASPGTISFFSNTGVGFAAAVTTVPSIGIGLPYNIRAVDFDNDGNLDVLFTRDSPGRLVFMHGNGDGTFTTVFSNNIGTNPRDLTISDFNGDGFPDVAIAMNGVDSVTICFNNGVGAIAAVSRYFSGGDGPQSIESRDMDGDGDIDIVVGNIIDFAVGVLYNDGTGASFLLRRFQSFKDPQEITLGNFDSDANPDIVFTSAGTKTINYMKNNGAGGFSNYNHIYDPAVITRPNSSASLDFTGDGFTDVVVANSTTNNFSFFSGNGQAQYNFQSSIATNATPVSIKAGDFTGDGINDVALLETSIPQIAIYPGNGVGGFGAPIFIPLADVPTELLAYDLDGDLDLDFVVVNNATPATGSITVFINNAGVYSLVANYTTNISGPTYVAAGFIDADNIIDLAICNNGNNRVLVYTGTGACNFVSGSDFAVSAGPDVVGLGDINGDGFTDFSVSYGTTATVSWAAGNGAGSFGATQNIAIPGASLINFVVVEDFNLDGFDDVIASSNGTADVAVLLGSSSALTFQSLFFCGLKPVHISVGSINGDQLPDIFVSNADLTAGGGSSVATIINRTAVITNSGGNSLCAGQSVTLTSTQSSHNYLWNSGQTTQAIIANSTNSYTVTTNNYNNSCSSTSRPENIVINLLPTVTNISGNTTICNGDNTTLTVTTDAASPVITWYDQLSGGTLLHTGSVYTTPPLVATTTYYIEVVDAATGCTNSPRESVTVFLGDITSPVFTLCPTNIVVSAAPGTCSATASWSIPTATDNCSTPSVNQTVGLPSGSSFAVGGPYTITYTALDANLNSTECTFSVTVTDNEFPVFTSCPGNIVLPNTAGTCGAIASWSAPLATDNCGAPTITQTLGLSSGSTFSVGVHNIEFTATDASGNATVCSFTVTINDVQNPVLVSCPTNITQNVTPGTCGRIVTWTAPTTTDNCSATVVQSAGPVSGSTFSVGSTNVTYTATDASGNTSSCSFSVTIVDNEPPVFVSCPSNLTFAATAGLCGRVLSGSTPTATDNCGVPTVTQTAGLISGSTFPVGVTTQTYQATDASGNIATCSYTITITDGQNPTIVGLPSNMSVTASANCDAVVNWTDPTVIDNCSGATITQTVGLPNGSTFPAGLHTITYVATDASGNAVNGSFTVNVVDATPPVFSNCPSNMTACQGDVVTFPTPTATDNCGGAVTVNQISGLPSGSVFNLGPNTVTFRATDANGNFTNCTFTITVNANPNATLTIPSATACLNDPLINIDFGTPSGGIYSGNGVSGTTFNPATAGTGPQTITYTVTNANGCSDDATDIIIVNSAPNVTFTINDNSACVNHPPYVVSGGSPSGGVYTGTGMTGSSFNPGAAGAGNHTITYTVTDGNGCTGQATDVINVSSCVGIDEVKEEELITIFPNPSNGLFTIQYENPNIDIVKIEVYNTIGQQVFSNTYNGPTIQIDLNNLVNGAYIVFMDANGNRVMKKIIIEK